MCVQEGIQAHCKSSFLNSQQIRMTEPLKGNTEHKALMIKCPKRLGFRYCLVFGASARDKPFGRVDLAFNPYAGKV